MERKKDTMIKTTSAINHIICSEIFWRNTAALKTFYCIVVTRLTNHSKTAKPVMDIKQV